MNNNSNGKKTVQETNKKIIILAVAILVVILIVSLIMRMIGGVGGSANKNVDVADIVKNGETKIIFVKDSGKNKCKKCDLVKKELDEQKINYVVYDVNEHSKKEYKEMLQSIDINPEDFGYPAVIYIKDGVLYSNVINITNKKAVQLFIESYNLTDVK